MRKLSTLIAISLPNLLLFCTGYTQNKSTLFEAGISRGEVSEVLKEASGLVSSIRNAGYLWAINDSGHTAEIFLLNDKAGIVMTCQLAGIKNRDWEDIAIMPGPDEKTAYLYIGDIGDNQAKYGSKYIYRIPEPLFSGNKNSVIERVEKLTIELPDGRRDAEALAVDYQSGSMYLISKREKNVRVYEFIDILSSAGTIVPKIIATLPYRNTVAADFSFDGSEFLLKTYDEIMYWKKNSKETFEALMKRSPEKLIYDPEPQGESIAWTRDGSGFYTLSEAQGNKKALLYFHKRK